MDLVALSFTLSMMLVAAADASGQVCGKERRSSVVPDWGRRTACPSRADKHRRVRANHPLLPVTASRSIGAVPHAGLSTGRRRLGRLRSGSAAASAWSTKRRPSPAVRRTWALARARPPSRSSSRTTAQVCAGARSRAGTGVACQSASAALRSLGSPRDTGQSGCSERQIGRECRNARKPVARWLRFRSVDVCGQAR